MKALLLLENNVEDAFTFSRGLKSVGVRCEFYTVATIDAAKRYLAAGASDEECVPAVIVVSSNFAPQAVTELAEWIQARSHLDDWTVVRWSGERDPLVGDRIDQWLPRPVENAALKALLSPRFDSVPLATASR